MRACLVELQSDCGREVIGLDRMMSVPVSVVGNLLRALGGLADKEISLCNSVVLCVSVVKLPRKTFTTEAQRLHREPQRHFCPVRLGCGLPLILWPMFR